MHKIIFKGAKNVVYHNDNGRKIRIDYCDSFEIHFSDDDLDIPTEDKNNEKDIHDPIASSQRHNSLEEVISGEERGSVVDGEEIFAFCLICKNNVPMKVTSICKYHATGYRLEGKEFDKDHATGYRLEGKEFDKDHAITKLCSGAFAIKTSKELGVGIVFKQIPQNNKHVADEVKEDSSTEKVDRCSYISGNWISTIPLGCIINNKTVYRGKAYTVIVKNTPVNKKDENGDLVLVEYVCFEVAKTPTFSAPAHIKLYDTLTGPSGQEEDPSVYSIIDKGWTIISSPSKK